jgi:cyclopropane-fatty-acyl-phospholipid synthase
MTALNAEVMSIENAPAGAIRLTAKEILRVPGLNGWMRAALGIVSKIVYGTLIIGLPDGRKFRFDGETPGLTGIMQIHDRGFAKKLLVGGGIGFAEAYLDEQWDSPDLGSLLRVIAHNNQSIGAAAKGRKWFNLIEYIKHSVFQRNSRSGARRNIEHHYDLGNEFYGLWLDKSMTYSSARFETGGENLEQAQNNKYRAMAERIGLEPRHHVLEIGCGWGGFAEFAAREYDCRVTAITISQEQAAYCRQRFSENGLNDKVEVLVKDYRDVEGEFDRIVSIEMFEAVGEAYWPQYFGKLRDSLKQGGLAGLQLITIAEQNFQNYRRSADFIQRYIFPGGMLPSFNELVNQITSARLTLLGHMSFGGDYAKTLHLWFERFNRHWPEIEKLGFDKRFRRMWSYYLAYCEGGFASQNTDVLQMTLARQ